jgi:hypothetical protein
MKNECFKDNNVHFLRRMERKGMGKNVFLHYTQPGSSFCDILVVISCALIRNNDVVSFIFHLIFIELSTNYVPNKSIR